MKVYYNHLYWHLLNALTLDGEYVEIMAAASDDGVGVIARWTRSDPESNEWTVTFIDTENHEMRPAMEDDEICVPLIPPPFSINS